MDICKDHQFGHLKAFPFESFNLSPSPPYVPCADNALIQSAKWCHTAMEKHLTFPARKFSMQSGMFPVWGETALLKSAQHLSGVEN